MVKDEAKKVEKEGAEAMEEKIKTYVTEAVQVELQVFIVPCCDIYVYCL